MKVLSSIFDFYLDASIHVALAVFCLVRITTVFLDLEENHHLTYYVFFGTIACYNFVKYGVEAEKYILVANKYHKNIQFFSFLALGVSLYHAYFLNLETWIGIAVLLLLTGLYSLPIIPGFKRLRSLGLLKILLVAMVWAGSTVLLPILATDQKINWDIGIETLQRLILVIVLLIPFEIRDLVYDRPDLRTLPQRYGIDNAKIIGIFATVFFFALTYLKDSLDYLEITSKGLLCLLLIMALMKTKKERSKYYASFWVEGIPVVWYIITLVVVSYF